MKRRKVVWRKRLDNQKRSLICVRMLKWKVRNQRVKWRKIILISFMRPTQINNFDDEIMWLCSIDSNLSTLLNKKKYKQTNGSQTKYLSTLLPSECRERFQVNKLQSKVQPKIKWANISSSSLHFFCSRLFAMLPDSTTRPFTRKMKSTIEMESSSSIRFLD